MNRKQRHRQGMWFLRLRLVPKSQLKAYRRKRRKVWRRVKNRYVVYAAGAPESAGQVAPSAQSERLAFEPALGVSR